MALPDETRVRYAKHLLDITGGVSQLLIVYEYDQSRMAGPPFSISNEEVERHYGGRYELGLLENRVAPGGVKGFAAVKEKVWVLPGV